MKSFKELYQENKRHVLIGAGVTCALVVATVSTLTIKKDNAFEIRINGEAVAIVRTLEEAQEVYNETLTKLTKDAGRDIAVHQQVEALPVHSKKEDVVDKEALKSELNDQLTHDVKAVELIIDGRVVAVVDSREVAEALIEEIALSQLPEGSTLTLAEGEQALTEMQLAVKEAALRQPQPEIPEEEDESDLVQEQSANADVYAAAPAAEEVEAPETIALSMEAPPLEEKPVELHVKDVERAEVITRTVTDNATRESIAFDFNQTVAFREAFVDDSAIMDVEDVRDVLLSETEEVVRYELEAGDNVWDIAIAHGTTMDRILEINPQIVDVTRMQIGEVIKVAAPDPVLSIRTTEVATFNELIPSEIEYVADDSLYKGEEKVKIAGNDGLREITVAVDKVNGKEVSRVHLSEKLLKEANTKVIAYGTKEKPKNTGGASVTPSKKGMFMHPLNGAGRISSQYGNRSGGYHRGIDLAAPKGTPIYAAASGTVTYSGYNNGGFGYLVIIDHGNGYQTYYAHNSKNYAKVGQKVSKGQNIAAVGSTGNSTGNHVHFEVRINGNPVNPYGYIY